ncbi:MAG: hypothetical protein L6R38_001951 [Xanthoria sp. 2 TBL-2021]|nr:MAG: hypothetical protein L6R38_001951 [Xanthoria sp. 2 TBL-2021]
MSNDPETKRPGVMDTTSLPDRPKPSKSQKQKPPKQSKAANAPKPKRAEAAKPAPDDPQLMFKVGFLSDVYQERSIESGAIDKVVTRFPPEPNGFLHIGHSKAIAINFGFAKHHGGECYLRFDDTNPKGEEEQYFVAIEEMVKWLGFEPKRVTYSSDNFDRLYALAEALVVRDRAYVCHCTKAEVIAQRGGGEGEGKPRYACPHRNRPTAESLTEFRAMRHGKYEAGEAALRMKQNLDDGNPQMWDLFAYRIPEKEHRKHHRTGDKWRIYPTYDFTHCLCDSLEGITHSLCTTEFELSRVSYEWLCDELEVYKPMQREYGRLNVSGTVLSKRKIVELVNKGHVRAWDDPRLYTLIALRRRGVPPGAILSFVNELGVTKATTNIELRRFETSIRRYLELTVPRLMLVLEPLTVVIDDLDDDHLEMVDVPFSKNPAYGSHTILFTKKVYIERSDFREVDSDDYFRLAPGKTVGLLKVPFPITATSIEKDSNSGEVMVVHAKYEKPLDGSTPKKPKSFIHWVASAPAHNSPIKATVRAFNPLFRSNNPAAHPDGFLADINPESEQIFPHAMIECGFEEIRQRAPWPAEAGEKKLTDAEKNSSASGVQQAAPGPETVRFQGMRVAYFCVDRETTKDDLILNRIVSLKEDVGKD